MKLIENHKPESKQIELKIDNPDLMKSRYNLFKLVDTVLKANSKFINGLHIDNLKNHKQIYFIKESIKSDLKALIIEIDKTI